jgi:hypothetical protein
MGKDGTACTGDPTDPIVSKCIVDARGIGGSLEFNMSDKYDGTGVTGTAFSLQSLTVGASYTPAFLYSYAAGAGNPGTNNTMCTASSGDAFCARVPADVQQSQAAQEIFRSNSPTASDQTYVCYRLNIPATQPAGYYYNKIKYTVSATF